MISHSSFYWTDAGWLLLLRCWHLCCFIFFSAYSCKKKYNEYEHTKNIHRTPCLKWISSHNDTNDVFKSIEKFEMCFHSNIESNDRCLRFCERICVFVLRCVHQRSWMLKVCCQMCWRGRRNCAVCVRKFHKTIRIETIILLVKLHVEIIFCVCIIHSLIKLGLNEMRVKESTRYACSVNSQYVPLAAFSAIAVIGAKVFFAPRFC